MKKANKKANKMENETSTAVETPVEITAITPVIEEPKEEPKKVEEPKKAEMIIGQGSRRFDFDQNKAHSSNRPFMRSFREGQLKKAGFIETELAVFEIQDKVKVEVSLGSYRITAGTDIGVFDIAGGTDHPNVNKVKAVLVALNPTKPAELVEEVPKLAANG